MKIKTFSQFVVPFRSALFSHEFRVNAYTKGEAKRAAMAWEEFAPARCFGTPRREKVLWSVGKIG